MKTFFSELKRRNVVKVGLAYVVVSWVLLQFVDLVSPLMGLPDVFQKGVLVLLAVFFPIALLLSWAYEVTPEGVKKTAEVDKSKSLTPGTGQKINKLIGGALVLALGFIAYDKFYTSSYPVVTEAQAAGTSIAVLPFVNMSDDEANVYFSDGISEELLNVLAKYKDLRVAARTSSFQFKGENPDIIEIGKKLGVDYVLEGSVRKDGNTVRITAQLIEAKTGFHMWSEIYERELVDVFAIQDEISAAIGNELREKLALDGGIESYAKVAQTTNPEAYQAYLLGKYLLNQRTRVTLEEAAGHFRAAIQLDPDYAAPYANLVITYGLLTPPGGYGNVPVKETLLLMDPLMARAMALAPDQAETWGAMYWVTVLGASGASFAESVKAVDRAVELNPSYMGARIWKGILLTAEYRYKEALEFSEESILLDPLNLIINNNHVEYLANAGRYTEAKEVADRVYSINPAWGNALYASLEWEQGNTPGAARYYLFSLRENPDNTIAINNFIRLLAETGFTEEVLRFPDVGWVVYIYISMLEKDWGAARDLALEEIERHPENPIVMPLLGWAYYTMKNFEGARESYDMAWPQNLDTDVPSFFQYEEDFIYYADVLRKTGQIEAADKQFIFALRGLKNMEVAGYINWRYYLVKGMALLYQGQNEDAIDAFEKSFEAGSWMLPEATVPLFDPVRDHPRFIALLEKYRVYQAKNKEKIRALICADDLPDFGWQPMEETCEGAGQ